MDMGFYRCEASNGQDTLSGETVIKIHPGNKRKGTSYWSDDDYDIDDYKESDSGLIPESFPLDLDGSLGSGAISGLPSHIEFQGRAPDDFQNNQASKIVAASTNNINGNVPSLKPNERAGQCQRYTGSVCRQHLGANFIFVSQGLTLDYIEQKLQASLQVISNSPELSKKCAKYAIPAICLSTLPLCDTQTQKPRKVLNFCLFWKVVRKYLFALSNFRFSELFQCLDKHSYLNFFLVDVSKLFDYAVFLQKV